MITNDELKKRTGNEPETKLPNSLKTKKVPKKRTGNEPENEAGHVVENKEQAKKRTGNKPETQKATILLKNLKFVNAPMAYGWR